MRVTNTTNGPRGLHAKSGAVLLAPGEAAVGVEMEPGEIASSKATGWFEFDEDAIEADPAKKGGRPKKAADPAATEPDLTDAEIAQATNLSLADGAEDDA